MTENRLLSALRLRAVKAPSSPGSGLRLLALAPLAVGALGWLVLAATTDEGWSEALIEAGVWTAVGVLAWFWPLVGAFLLVVGAAFGLFLALLVSFVATLMALDKKHSDVGKWFWIYLGWWFVLPLVSAFLFTEARRERIGARFSEARAAQRSPRRAS
jgi:hypothetical protein